MSYRAGRKSRTTSIAIDLPKSNESGYKKTKNKR